MATVFGSIGNFIKKSMSAGSSAASSLDYSMKSLETQAFLLNIRAQASALNDAETMTLLSNYLVTEEDSDNVRKLVTAAKLQQQQQAPSVSNTLTNNLLRR